MVYVSKLCGTFGMSCKKNRDAKGISIKKHWYKFPPLALSKSGYGSKRDTLPLSRLDCQLPVMCD